MGSSAISNRWNYWCNHREMNKRINLLTILSLFLFTIQTSLSQETLWDQFSANVYNPSKVAFYIDGKLVGVGKVGFEAVRKKIGLLPKWTEVRLVYPLFPVFRHSKPFNPFGNRIARKAEKRGIMVTFELKKNSG